MKGEFYSSEFNLPFTSLLNRFISVLKGGRISSAPFRVYRKASPSEDKLAYCLCQKIIVLSFINHSQSVENHFKVFSSMSRKSPSHISSKGIQFRATTGNFSFSLYAPIKPRTVPGGFKYTSLYVPNGAPDP